MLYTHALFSAIAHTILDRLIAEKKIFQKSYHKNQTIYNQGDTCTCMDVIISGRVVAYSLAPNGSETVVFTFQQDDVIGGNLLFGTRNTYPMTMYCTKDCILLHISKAAVQELLRQYPFVLQFVQILSCNAQGINQKLAMHTGKTLRANLLEYLQALSATQKSETILLPMTKKQLADYLGVQRPSLFRELKNLQEEGILHTANRHITLLDCTKDF